MHGTGIIKPIGALFGALRGQTRDVRGGAAVEVALTGIALVMFLFGIIQFGFAMWLQSALNYSVAEAARCASVNATVGVCDSASAIQTYANNQSGYDFVGSSSVPVFSVTTPDPPCGKEVKASYPLTITIPTFAFSVNLGAQACYPS